MAAADLVSKVANLESTIKSLDVSFDRVESWLLGFTLLVVVGLIIEYWDDIRKLRTFSRRQRTGLDWPSHTDNFGAAFRAVIGGILVTIGVAGELVEEFQGYRIGTSSRDANAKIVALLTDEAKTAERKIADDDKIATQAAQNAAQLGVTVQTLPTFVAKKEDEFNAQLAGRIKKSGTALDQARTDAQQSETKAEAALAAFRKEAGPRTLTSDQRSRFISALRGKMKTVLVRSVQNEGESYLYAADIMVALRSAEITPEYNPWGLTGYLTLHRGDPDVLILEYGQGENAQAKALISAFSAARIRVTEVAATGDDARGTPTAQILVAPKPPPLLAPEKEK
ncbi:MAG: hypothetical protein ACRD3S_09930 [Terracidiphilus sp.]